MGRSGSLERQRDALFGSENLGAPAHFRGEKEARDDGTTSSPTDCIGIRLGIA